MIARVGMKAISSASDFPFVLIEINDCKQSRDIFMIHKRIINTLKMARKEHLLFNNDRDRIKTKITFFFQ